MASSVGSVWSRITSRSRSGSQRCSPINPISSSWVPPPPSRVCSSRSPTSTSPFSTCACPTDPPRRATSSSCARRASRPWSSPAREPVSAAFGRPRRCARGGAEIRARGRGDRGDPRGRRGRQVASTEWAAAIDGDPELDDVGLSPRQLEVLELYASGEKLDRVARLTGLAPQTVNDYLQRIRQKYAEAGRPAPTKTDLYKRAVEDGWLPMPERSDVRRR